MRVVISCPIPYISLNLTYRPIVHLYENLHEVPIKVYGNSEKAQKKRRNVLDLPDPNHSTDIWHRANMEYIIRVSDTFS